MKCIFFRLTETSLDKGWALLKGRGVLIVAFPSGYMAAQVSLDTFYFLDCC